MFHVLRSCLNVCGNHWFCSLRRLFEMDQKPESWLLMVSACLYLLSLEMNVSRFLFPPWGVSFCCQPAGAVNKACCHMVCVWEYHLCCIDECACAGASLQKISELFPVCRKPDFMITLISVTAVTHRVELPTKTPNDQVHLVADLCKWLIQAKESAVVMLKLTWYIFLIIFVLLA